MTSQSHSRRRKPECPVEDVFIFREQEFQVTGRISADRTKVHDVQIFFRGVNVTHTFSNDEFLEFVGELLEEYSKPIVDELDIAKRQRERELETIA